MRKRLLALLLLVPILVISIISCEGDALAGLSDLMRKMGSNALIESGLVKVDTSHGERIGEALSGLKDLDEDGYKAVVQDIKEDITKALSSPEKKEALKEKMQEEVDKDDIPQKVKDLLDGLKEEGDGEDDFDFEIETQGDLIAAILVAELFEKVEEFTGDGEDGFDWEEMTDEEREEAMGLISEALEVLEIIETISPTNAVGINELLEAFGVSSMRTSRGDGEGLTGELEAIIEMLIDSIGTTDEGEINRKNLSSMITNYGLMRKTYEKLAPKLKGSNQELEVNDALNYLLSVFFTEANKLFKDAPDDKKFADLIDAYLVRGHEGNYEDFGETLSGAGELMDILSDGESTVYKTFHDILAAVPGSDWIESFIEDLFK